ncbi:MAG: hypothetical protein WCE80_05890 [Acidimicrobiia bacterium]
MIRQLPNTFNETRDALHQIAFFAMGPARYAAAGLMGLRPTPGGFGTPVFDGSVARVEGDMLVFEHEGNVATQVISTVGAAAEFFGVAYEVEWFPDFHDPLAPVAPDVPLHVDRGASLALGDWFRFGFDLLVDLSREGGAGDDVSKAQLWPEHFDPAIEMGSHSEGRRASFGASPGDARHPAPYFYVAPWGVVDRSDPFWNDEAFGGASLGYDILLDADDPSATARAFLLTGLRLLGSR